MYKGSGDVAADGADAADVRRWRLKRQADGAAAHEVAGADSGSAESVVDAALEAALDAAGSDDFDDYDDGDDDGGGSSGSDEAGAGPVAGAPSAREAAGASVTEGRGAAGSSAAAPVSFSQVRYSRRVCSLRCRRRPEPQPELLRLEILEWQSR